MSNTYPGTNVNVFAAGWGTLSSGGSTPNNLNNVKLTAYAASSCSRVTTNLGNGQICAGIFLFVYLKRLYVCCQMIYC